MNKKLLTAWALQRPIGEIVTGFVRRTKSDVIASLVSVQKKRLLISNKWLKMRRMVFRIVRVIVLKKWT